MLWILFSHVDIRPSDVRGRGPLWRTDGPAHRWGAALDSDWLGQALLTYPGGKKAVRGRTAVNRTGLVRVTHWCEIQTRVGSPREHQIQTTSVHISWRLQRSGWRRQWQPTPVLLPENPMGGGALVQGVAKSQTRRSDLAAAAEIRQVGMQCQAPDAARRDHL